MPKAHTLITLFFLAVIQLTSVTASGNYVQLNKCRYCRQGTTHSLMMFLKYDKPSFDSSKLKLEFTSK